MERATYGSTEIQKQMMDERRLNRIEFAAQLIEELKRTTGLMGHQEAAILRLAGEG